jgi:hypothetical protein
MELCTAEEIHVICLFPHCDAAEGFGGVVYPTLPEIGNKPEIFGSQIRMDAGDRQLGLEPRLLTTASSISIDDLPALCRGYGGICYPAHIDRPSHSILAVFGVIEDYMGFRAAELMPASDADALKAKHPALADMCLLRSSDAHALEMMVTEPREISLPACTAEAVIAGFRALEGR